ncbi:hypothetical protein [Photorhabdus asymbiotica]|uniref:hypothetical protein n=1 Tax=Photorhabdus asymbiotica TaxID=291112 RepID=UPI003DA78DD4
MDEKFQQGNLPLDGFSRIKEFASLYLCLFTLYHPDVTLACVLWCLANTPS